MNTFIMNCILEKQRKCKKQEFQQKSEREQKRQWNKEYKNVKTTIGETDWVNH